MAKITIKIRESYEIRVLFINDMVFLTVRQQMRPFLFLIHTSLGFFNHYDSVKRCKKRHGLLCTSNELPTFALAKQLQGAFSSAGLEHLPYKQRVCGSNP